jgi:hypothetical protein
VREFGSAHAESRLLHAITQEMMVSSVLIDAAAVERFRLALLEAITKGQLR